MMPPRLKEVSRFAPDLLRRLIPQALMRRYSGLCYDAHGPCPSCGSERVIGFGWLERTFCIVITENGFRDVNVRVRRYMCKGCRHTFLADAPFYDGCLYGKPIVDLCLYLAASNPFNRVESILTQYGIQVDRDTVKNYTILFRDRVMKQAGIPVMDDSKIGVNILKLLFDVDSVEELREMYPQAKYDAVMDETYPRVKGAKKALAEERYVKKMVGERKPKYPESFTLAASYMNHLECFSSLSCRRAPFNSLVAEALAKPLKGCDAIITDGSQCYDNVRSYRCLWHKMKNFFNTDPFINKHTKEKLPPWTISSHMHQIYTFAEQEYVEWLREKHPNLVDELSGGFIGALTSNTMEGGNWRLKYELRADYVREESIEGRCLLIAIKDSTKTFKEGRPHRSFTNTNTTFNYQKIMGRRTIAGQPVETYIYH
jgi:hypothetical protein